MGGARILIVEDEQIVALDTRMHLERNDYTVVGIHASGEEAVASIESTRPDLVLMDIQLQGELDGVETAEIIKDRFGLPVILLTAYADDETVQRAKLTQPFAYLIKPFEERELRTAIVLGLYRHRMEKALFERERLFSTTLRAIADAVVVLTADETIEFMNLGAERLIGRKLTECRDRPVRDFVTVEETDGEYSMQLVVADTRIPVERTVSPLLDDDGTKTGSVWVIRDISEKVAIENKLRASEVQLRHAQKMDAIGRLTGGIAHDFNNLLTVILGYSRLMREYAAENVVVESREIISDIDGIQKAAQKSVTVIRQLLAFSRGQIMKPTIVDANSVVQDLKGMLVRFLPNPIRLESSLDTNPASVNVDKGMLEQVVVNLVVNARDAIESDGVITLATANLTLHDGMTVSTGSIPPGAYITISVHDTGTGIPDEVRDQIFEPFFTTKSSEKGSGLGLSTAYGIVEQLKGKINVDTKLGEGTTFTLYFPAEHGVGAERVKNDAPTNDTVGTETIGIIGDRDTVHEMMEKVLARYGYTIVSGSAADDAPPTRPDGGGPDLFLIAVGHGDDVTAIVDAIRETADVPIIVVTGNRRQHMVESLEPNDKVHVLHKPFEPSDLSGAVRRILDQHSTGI